MSETAEIARKRLRQLRSALDDAVANRNPVAFALARAQLLLAERELASLEKHEYAEPIVGVPWKPGHPLPLIWNDGHAVWLICPQPSLIRPLLCRVVKFHHVVGLRTSTISDTLEEQPLDGWGLESCMALEVRNSEWISCLRKTYNDECYWSDMRHFAFCFRDSLVEVVAKSVEWLEGERPMVDSINHVTERARQAEKIDEGRPFVGRA